MGSNKKGITKVFSIGKIKVGNREGYKVKTLPTIGAEPPIIAEVRIELHSDSKFNNSRFVNIMDSKSREGADARMVVIRSQSMIQTITKVNERLIEDHKKGKIDLSGDAF